MPRETATLRGPAGEEQAAATDLAASEDEYLVVGDTWTNTEATWVEAGSECVAAILRVRRPGAPVLLLSRMWVTSFGRPLQIEISYSGLGAVCGPAERAHPWRCRPWALRVPAAVS